MIRSTVLPALLVAALLSGCGGTVAAKPDAPRATTADDTRQVAVGPPGAEDGATISGDAARKVEVPVLMYHVIAKAKPGETYPELWVPPARFAAQVQALADAGYHAITLHQLMEAWEKGDPVPDKPVVLTFDDGYLSQSTNAAPVLAKHGWPGVLYLTTRNIGPTIPKSSVKKLLRSGWELGAHTATHPDLRTLDAAGREREIDDVRIQLRAEFDQDVESFCYPAGKYDEAVVAAVKAAGYRSATTVAPGWAEPSDNPYLLQRVRVDPQDGPQRLLKKITAWHSSPDD
ncbi:MAG: polysaccharide deacetylase family protein [Solirubrobacteraceae bacterium]|nr:polysaccharide deacetylase family protein [Solirubrobacteraceae bacterium]